MTDSHARLAERLGYCTARHPENGKMCQRPAGHDPAIHAYAGTKPEEEQVWVDDEKVADPRG